jgi:arylsulfatase A-like enzyme
MVSQYDLMPTLLETLGLPAVDDPSLPGRSFLPVLRGDADEARENVVVYDEYGPVRMIRTPEWKYVHRHPFGPHELYDMVADPDERKELFGDKSKQSVVTEMRSRLARWFERYVDPRLDGTRFPVYGDGQLKRIDDDCCGENAFQEREQRV